MWAQNWMWLLLVEDSEGTSSVVNGRWMAEFSSTFCLLMSPAAAMAAAAWPSRQGAWPFCPSMEFCVSGAAGVDASAETHCGIDFLRESAAQEDMADFRMSEGCASPSAPRGRLYHTAHAEQTWRMGAGVDDWDAGTLGHWCAGTGGLRCLRLVPVTRD